MELHQQYHFRESENGLLAWDVLKLIKLSTYFDVVEVPFSEIRELKEAYWFGFGAPPISEEIAQHAKQIYEADLSYPTILCRKVGSLMVCTEYARHSSKLMQLIWL